MECISVCCYTIQKLYYSPYTLILNTIPIDVMNRPIFPYLIAIRTFRIRQSPRAMIPINTEVALHTLPAKMHATKTVNNVLCNTKTVFGMFSGGLLFYERKIFKQ